MLAIAMLATLKGGAHGHFHIAFLVPMFSLGGIETQDSILISFRMHLSSKICCQNNVRMCIVMVSSICGIA